MSSGRDIRLVGHGINDEVPVQVDGMHRAVRTSLRPPELGIYGSYRATLKSGVIAAGLAGPLPVWEMRWGSQGVIAIVRSLRIQAVASTTAFGAASDSSFSLFRAQGFTALDGTSATLAAFTKSKAQGQATRLGSSQFASDSTANRTVQGGIAILNTAAAGLTGGTKILDDSPLAVVLNAIPATAAAETALTPVPAPYLIDPSIGPALQPLEFWSNEGLVLQCDAIPVTGTWRLMAEVAWDEVDPERYFGNYH